eukprot:13037916-Ditylum_brightwellii.AAC.1
MLMPRQTLHVIACDVKSKAKTICFPLADVSSPSDMGMLDPKPDYLDATLQGGHVAWLKSIFLVFDLNIGLGLDQQKNLPMALE